MARAQAVVGDASLPAFFTGHAPDGGPLRTGRHDHLFFLAEDANGEGRIDRLAVIAPHLADRTVNPERKRLDELDLALSGLSIVRAGAAGAPGSALSHRPATTIRCSAALEPGCRERPIDRPDILAIRPIGSP